MSGAIGTHHEDEDNSKSAEELLRELAVLNHNDEAISIDRLAQNLKAFRECIHQDGVQRQQPISNWTTEGIKSWADELKQQRHARELAELLAVACHACKLVHGYYSREAQLLISILLMLSPSKAGRRGHLQQIATCEGKTAIVALFVVVKALRDGVKIDVETSRL